MDGIIKMIFAAKRDADSKDPCTFEHFMDYKDAVVLDIDASIAHISTNVSEGESVNLPRFPGEFAFLR
jgi:hypothetical protein